MHTNDFFLFVAPVHLCLGVNPYCSGEIDFPVKKAAAPTDRQPYSLCSNRKSLSQQLDHPVSVRWRGGAWRCGRTRGSVVALVLFCSLAAESLLSLLKHPARHKSFGRTVKPPLGQVHVTTVTSMLLGAHREHHPRLPLPPQSSQGLKHPENPFISPAQ